MGMKLPVLSIRDCSILGWMVHAVFTFKGIYIAMGNMGYTTIPSAMLKWCHSWCDHRDLRLLLVTRLLCASSHCQDPKECWMSFHMDIRSYQTRISDGDSHWQYWASPGCPKSLLRFYSIKNRRQNISSCQSLDYRYSLIGLSDCIRHRNFNSYLHG